MLSCVLHTVPICPGCQQRFTTIFFSLSRPFADVTGEREQQGNLSNIQKEAFWKAFVVVPVFYWILPTNRKYRYWPWSLILASKWWWSLQTFYVLSNSKFSLWGIMRWQSIESQFVWCYGHLARAATAGIFDTFTTVKIRVCKQVKGTL